MDEEPEPTRNEERSRPARRHRIQPINLAELPTVLDVDDLSDVLRISKERVARLADDGTLQRLAYSPRRLLVWSEEVLRFLAESSTREGLRHSLPESTGETIDGDGEGRAPARPEDAPDAEADHQTDDRP